MSRDTNAVSHLEVRVPTGTVSLEGTLSLPTTTAGLVVFAHGSGSSRRSPRNRYVADHLNERRISTLLVDLLTPGEAEAGGAGATFDLARLGDRLVSAVDWACVTAGIGSGKLGLFGASTGSAVALLAAARRPDCVRAVVSRGGRPDLASSALPGVRAPTLLIVGSKDAAVLDLNLTAARALSRCALEQVPGAGHLFEEPGAIRRVAELTTGWFARELEGPKLVASSVAELT